MESKEKIDIRLKLLKACIKGDIEITEEILEVLDTDKSLLTFAGEISSIGTFTPIPRNTVVNHGQLANMQNLRAQAKYALTKRLQIEDSPPNKDEPSKKETKTSLKADKTRLEREVNALNSELASIRSAYRQLLKEVQHKLPFDKKVAEIVKSHNQSSIERERKTSLKVIQ